MPAELITGEEPILIILGVLIWAKENENKIEINEISTILPLYLLNILDRIR
jgi:hypothetical protein